MSQKIFTSIRFEVLKQHRFIRLLALLDKRLGKRRLKGIIDNTDNESEWFKKWIKLRDTE